jgi:hypothetical protein
MKVVSVRGNKVTLDLSNDERNFLFRIGLQILLDKWSDRKIVVLPVGAVPVDGDVKKIENGDDVEHFCLTEAVNQILRESLAKMKAEDKARKSSHKRGVSCGDGKTYGSSKVARWGVYKKSPRKHG